MRSPLKRRRGYILLIAAFPLALSADAVRLGETVEANDTVHSGYIETHGVLEPGRRYVRRLESGQRLVQMLVASDHLVSEGAVIAVLADDALNSQLLALEERRLAHLRDVQERDLLQLEVEEARSELQRLKEELEEERHLETQLPGYSSAVRIRELQLEQRRQQAALQLKNGKLKLISNHLTRAASIQDKIDTRLAALRQRVAALGIAAPFAGRIVNVALYPQTLLPGEVLFELWDERSHRVIVDLWQNQVGHVKPGDKAEIVPDFNGTAKLSGTVREILPSRPAPEPRSYPRFPAVIELETGKEAALVVGMSVAVRIRVAR